MFQDPPCCLCWEKSKTLWNVILLVLQQMEDWVYASCPVDFPLMFQFNLFCSKCQQKIELSKKKWQEFFSVTYSPAWMGLTGDITLRFSFWHTEVKKHCFTAVSLSMQVKEINCNFFSSYSLKKQYTLFMLKDMLLFFSLLISL